MKNSDSKRKVEDILRNHSKSKKTTQKEVAKISQKVIVQLYKPFWQRRSLWSNKLENI
jgi:hypothetical protein